MSATDQYIDLIASGDKGRIECVLGAALGGSLTAGVATGIAFAPANAVPVAGTAFNGMAAGIGAVLGALAGGKAGLKYCPGQSGGDDFNRLFSQDKISVDRFHSVATEAQNSYGLNENDSRLLAKAALVYAYRFDAPSAAKVATPNEMSNGIAILIEKLRKEGLTV